MPLALLGEGTSRLTSIVLAILSSTGGFVLIDEIENGLHHSCHKTVSAALFETAQRADVQVFATTHSREFATAACAAASERLQPELAYIRLERSNGAVRAISYSLDDLKAADEFNWEIR